jgi:hypothetical protein
MRRAARRVRDNRVDGSATVATHYFELTESSQSDLTSFYLKFGAALVTSSITFQTTNLAEVPADATAATGDWFTETAVTVTNAAAAAAGYTYHVGNFGAMRARLVVVVTTGGGLDIAICDKSA